MKNKSIGDYISRVRELPPGVMLKKALVKLVVLAVHKLEKAGAWLSPAHISDEQLLESLDGFTNLREGLDHIRGERPKFFIDPSRKGHLIPLIQKEFPQLKDQIVEEADKVCSHVFDLLGSGDVNLQEFVGKHGEKNGCGYLPWHFDFKTGYRWSSRKFYKEIRIPYGMADIKVPWELSRFQHVATLGQAYWLTADERYPREFVKEIDDWIDRNPPRFGVNWACTMDVAIRVANWIWGYYFFKDSEALTNEFMLKFLKSLLSHGRHIMGNLEWSERLTSNHYLSNLVGLIYLGITFPEFKEAKHWREFGIQELIKEMEKQVYDDGMDFEASTCYHRLVLELFFYTTLLCKLNGIELPSSFIDKLKKMFDFVLYVLKPNGRMPQIGDNDNGRLHVLGTRDILDMTYLLTSATLFFDDPKYKIEEFGFAPEALWLFGPEAYDRWREMLGQSVEELESRAFPDGGIYVMRHKKDYMVISCGPNGQNGNGGHAHNDKLSFELCVDGEDIIVDPGTYIYTADPEWRDTFRSTASHNTVMVDGEEQNRFSVASLFEMQDDAKARCTHWESNSEYDLFIGEHFGYTRLTPAIVHRRLIQFQKGLSEWKVEDSVGTANKQGGKSAYIIELSLALAPDVHVETKETTDEGMFLLLARGGARLKLRLMDNNSLNVVFRMTEPCYSPHYGAKQITGTLKWMGKLNHLRKATLYLVKDQKC